MRSHGRRVKLRYEQLIFMVLRDKPEVVVEIGTWNGIRAKEMFLANPNMTYYGFDLFETASPDTDAHEKNVKAHFSKEQVEARLGIHNATLIRGNTNETFTLWADEHPESVDLVYIDGGHSVETIQSDYMNALKVIKPGGKIVFDDYYEDMPDIDLYGANRVLEQSGRDYHVLPMKDPVVGGGFTKMAVMEL